MRGWGIPIVGLVLISFNPARLLAGQQKSCTDAEEAQAEKAVDSLKTWDQVYRSYKQFAQCDDGAVAEGYSDAVGKLLANDWTHFPRLVRLAKTDKDFERFVVRHVDESLTGDTLQKISKNARTGCPADAHALCTQIADAASGK
jgi:hypothetical protein